MFSPHYFNYIQARSIYGNDFPKKSNVIKTYRYLQLLSCPEDRLTETALAFQKDAIFMFCYPEITQKLSLRTMIEIFITHPVLAENIINTPTFKDFLKNIDEDAFAEFFEFKGTLDVYKKIFKNSNFDNFNKPYPADFYDLACRLRKTIPLVDLKNLKAKPAQDCIALLEKLIACCPDETAKKGAEKILAILFNEDCIQKLNDATTSDLTHLGKFSRSIAEEILNTSHLLNKLSREQLQLLCYTHFIVADKVIATKDLLSKTFETPTNDNKALMLQQAILASPHHAIAENLFYLFAPLFCPPFSSRVELEQYGKCLFFLGKEQPSIAKKILETPHLCSLLNEEYSKRLKCTVALWETMQKICIRLAAPPISDPSSETEISEQVQKLKIG